LPVELDGTEINKENRDKNGSEIVKKVNAESPREPLKLETCSVHKLHRKKIKKELKERLVDSNYILAVSLKKEGKYEEATRLYQNHAAISEALENQQLGSDFFALMMLPSLDSRRKMLNVLEDILGYLNDYGNVG